MIDAEKRNMAEEVTLDLSDSMRKTVRTISPKANRVIDRFHIQKLACDAVQELNLQTIGHNGKKREHLYCLMNTQISSRHMDYAIPYE